MKRQAVEAAARRRGGASPERRQAINEAFRSAPDLYARCPRCGATLTGTLDALKRQMAEHTCA